MISDMRKFSITPSPPYVNCGLTSVLFTDLLFLFITERVDPVCQNDKVFAFAIPAALNDPHQPYTCRIESRPYSGESSRLLCAAPTDLHAASSCQLRTAHRVISIAAVWRCRLNFKPLRDHFGEAVAHTVGTMIDKDPFRPHLHCRNPIDQLIAVCVSRNTVKGLYTRTNLDLLPE